MSLISASRCSAAARPRASASCCSIVHVAEHAVEQQRGVADQRVDRRPQLVRHAGEELRFELVRALDFLRLPLQPRVLLGQVGGRLADPLFELAVEAFQRIVEPLVLHLLGEIVQHRDDGDRLAAFVSDLARDHLDGQLDAALRVGERHAPATRIVVEQRELRDERRELGIVAAHGRDLTARSGVAVADLEELLGLLVHQNDVRTLVGDENRIGDVLEDEIQAIALAAHGDLSLPHALHLPLELVRGAAEVGDVAEHGQHGVFGADALAERMREHFEQEVVAFVGIDEVELARSGLMSCRPSTAFDRNDVKSRLLSSSARRRPGESSSRPRSSRSARWLWAMMSFAAFVMTTGSGSESTMSVSRSRCSISWSARLLTSASAESLREDRAGRAPRCCGRESTAASFAPLEEDDADGNRADANARRAAA